MYVDLPCSFRILGMHSALDYHWDSSFQFLGESHPDWETVCVLDGQVEVAEDDKIYILKAGDYICHGSMEFHRIRSSGGTTPHVLIICFKHEGTMPPALLDGVFSLNPAELENYQRLFEKLYSYCHGEITDPYASTKIASALGNFFIQLSRKQTRSSRRSQSRTAMEFQRLVKAMQKHGIRIPEDISLMGMEAEELNTSFYPPITAIRQDFEKLAQFTVDALTQAIEKRTPVKNIRVPYTLIERSSVRKKD